MALEISYAQRTPEKRAMWAMKISPKVKYLAGIAARAQGKTLSGYVEATIEASFAGVKITDDQEGSDGKTIPGYTLAELANTLYKGTEATRFLALVKVAPWLISDGESKLLRVLQHSEFFAPPSKGSRILHPGRIQEHWTLLAAIRDGEADVDILPASQRPNAALAFGLMGDPERIALYKTDPAKFKRESAAYAKAMKGNK
jgi:hypothetical protein